MEAREKAIRYTANQIFNFNYFQTGKKIYEVYASMNKAYQENINSATGASINIDCRPYFCWTAWNDFTLLLLKEQGELKEWVSKNEFKLFLKEEWDYLKTNQLKLFKNGTLEKRT